MLYHLVKLFIAGYKYNSSVNNTVTIVCLWSSGGVGCWDGARSSRYDTSKQRWRWGIPRRRIGNSDVPTHSWQQAGDSDEGCSH